MLLAFAGYVYTHTDHELYWDGNRCSYMRYNHTKAHTKQEMTKAHWFKSQSMYIPDLVAKHLKLLSQNPHTITTSFSGMAAKQAAEAERLWSRGSPNRAFNPTAMPKNNYKQYQPCTL